MTIEDISNNSKQPSLLLLMLPGIKFIILVCCPTGSISYVVVPLTAEIIKDATLLEKKSRNLKEQLTVKKNEISPFYFQWSPTSCTLVSCHMLFMTKNSLYLINFQCTWQQGLIKLFPILNSRNTTTWHRNIHNLHTMWQQTQQMIRHN